MLYVRTNVHKPDQVKIIELGRSIETGITRWVIKYRQMIFNRRNLTLPWILFLLALMVYLLVRIIGLANFPIYFFTDEAAQTVLAQDFLRDHFKNYMGEFFPAFFENGGKYNLGFSVYAQIIPLILFGKSVFITRLVSVLFSLFAAIAIGFTLRNIIKIHNWWVGVMILSLTPAWFLHSRTAFETALAVSLYAIFLCFYLMYRFCDRKYLYLALLFGFLAFYSYSSMQLVILATGCLFLILDGPYHLRGRWVTLIGAGEIILLSLPYIRFIFNHPGESYHQMEMLGSYWVSAISLTEKIHKFFSEYLNGLNPVFWYGNNPYELIRHVMLGYGYLPRLLFPFLFIGLFYSLMRLKDPVHRILLAILLVAPVGTATVHLGITRILVLIIPATIFTAIGLSFFLDWFSRFRLNARMMSVAVFLLFSTANFWMLVDVLRNGPLWFRDYSLDGMQYGARQIFPAAMEYLDKNPQKKVILSPSWANGTDVVARFMLYDPLPIELGSIDGYFDTYRQITPDTTFIMIPDEYQRVINSEKFTNIHLLQTVNYPDGNPGFYFVSLEYSPGIMQKLEAEKEARRELHVDHLLIDGIQVEVRYSTLDMGVIGAAFDGNNATVIRTLEANPLVIELVFQKSLVIKQISLRIGGTTTKSTLMLDSVDGKHMVMEEYASEASTPRDVFFNLPNPISTTFIRIEIKSVYDPEPAHVHLWEIKIE